MEEEHIKVNKNDVKGRCITCARGLFAFYAVWCMHPKLPSGYKLHSPFETCEGYKRSFEFKMMDNILKVPRNKKYVDPYIDKNGEVKKNDDRSTKGVRKEKHNTTSGRTNTNKVSTNSKPNIKERKRVEEKS